jgi:hypothetical protein
MPCAHAATCRSDRDRSTQHTTTTTPSRFALPTRYDFLRTILLLYTLYTFRLRPQAPCSTHVPYMPCIHSRRQHTQVWTFSVNLPRIIKNKLAEMDQTKRVQESSSIRCMHVSCVATLPTSFSLERRRRRRRAAEGPRLARTWRAPALHAAPRAATYVRALASSHYSIARMPCVNMIA